MRRKDREITDFNKMIEIVDNCDCCRIGLKDFEEGVYIVPLNFGYSIEDNKLVLYFHGANEGKKIDLIKLQSIASFEMDTKHELVVADEACKHTYMYQSVMGKGEITILDDFDEKVAGLNIIMKKYSDKPNWEFREEMVNRVAVIKLEVINWSCKEH